MAKINWLQAKHDYISDPKQSLSSIAEKYGVALTTVKNKSVDEKWQELRVKTLQNIDQKTTEKIAEEISEVNARQANIGKALQGIAIRAINKKDAEGNPILEAKSIDEVRLLSLTGVTIERKALNIEEQGNQPIAIQINFGSKEVDEWAT